MPTYEDASEQYEFDPDRIIETAISGALLRFVEFAFTDSCIAESWVECDLVGDRTRGGFVGGDGEGNVSVVAWEGRDVVAFEYRLGFGPAEQLALGADAPHRGVEDLRGFLPGMPASLEPVFQRAAALVRAGHDGRPGASAGLWVTPEDVGSSIFGAGDDYQPGREILRWGLGADDEWDAGSYDGDEVVERALHAEVIVDRLVARLRDGAVAVTPEESAAILATGATPRAEGIERLKAAFRAAHIDWP